MSKTDDDLDYDRWLEEATRKKIEEKRRLRAERFERIASELNEEIEPLMSAIVKIADLEEEVQKLKEINKMLSWRK